MEFIRKEIKTFKEEVGNAIKKNTEKLAKKSFLPLEILEIEKTILAIKDASRNQFVKIPLDALVQTEHIKLAFYQELLKLQKRKLERRFISLKVANKMELERVEMFNYHKFIYEREFEIYQDLQLRIEQCKQRLSQISQMRAFAGTIPSSFPSTIQHLKGHINQVKFNVFFKAYQQTFEADEKLDWLSLQNKELLRCKVIGTIADEDIWAYKLRIGCKLLEKVDESYEKTIQGSVGK